MSAKVWKEYDLDNVAIEEISEDVQSYMKEIGEESRNIHRNRLVIEELLLRIKDSSDEVKKICVLIGRQYGRHVFRMTYNGVAFDPTSNEESSFILLETIGLVPMWGYKRGQNTVSMTLSGRAKKGRLFKILLAVVAAGALGYLGTFMPVGIKQDIDESLLAPLINCFLGLLSTFSGFMIALTISSGVLGGETHQHFLVSGKRLYQDSLYLRCWQLRSLCWLHILFLNLRWESREEHHLRSKSSPGCSLISSHRIP
jgi:hypothetical protein